MAWFTCARMEAMFTPSASSSFFWADLPVSATRTPTKNLHSSPRKDGGSHQPQFRAAIQGMLGARMLESSDRPTALGSTARVVTSSCGGFPANLQLYRL